MNDIKFTRQIMQNSKRKNGVEVGNAIYFPFENGNRAKICCEDCYIRAEIVNKLAGKIDSAELWFRNYFGKVKCSSNAPEWVPHIENGKWYFSDIPHCLPKTEDFKRLAQAADAYMDLFE